MDPAGNASLCDVINLRITSVVDKSTIEAFDEFKKHQLVRAVANPHPCPRHAESAHLGQHAAEDATHEHIH